MPPGQWAWHRASVPTTSSTSLAGATTRASRVISGESGNVNSSFASLVHAWAAGCPSDPSAAAVARFYAAGKAAAVVRPEKWASKQLVLLTVDGQPVTEFPSLRRFWAAEVERRKASGSSGARRGICLVCASEGTLVNTLPQLVPRRLVPLAGNDASLVSGNEPIHTYDFAMGLSTVPICLPCATQAVNSLQDVLSDPNSHLSYGDSSMGWWMLGSQSLDLAATLAVEDPESVRSLVERVRRSGTWSDGIDRPVLDAGRFCAVTIRGSAARVMVRDWIDMPLERLEANVAAWFADHAMDGGSPDRPPYHPLWLLVLCVGRWIPDRDRVGGRYADLAARNSARPPDTGRQLLRAALLRAAIPSQVLAHLIIRIRADRHVDSSRAALLRLILTRTPAQLLEVPMTGLDPGNRDPAYLAGRIFAVLEQLQRSSAGDRANKNDGGQSARQVNTSFTDRILQRRRRQPAHRLDPGPAASAGVAEETEPGKARHREQAAPTADGPVRLP